MLHSYGIIPMKEDHFEERCQDILEQVQSGVITMPLFLMVLVPEGNPVWDKVSAGAALFARYRDALERHGIDCGILVQASFGHGYCLTENPFQKYVNLTDGQEAFVCCPEDEAFLAHFSDVLRRLAREHPKVIMLDDDFRLLMRPGKGCACDRHMRLFREATGLNMSREALWHHIEEHGNDDLAVAFAGVQNASLLKAAKVFREAIDSVDPSIQGINCTSGEICEESWKTNAVFAGKGNPTTVRLPNGIYAPFSVRGISDLMRRTAICGSKLKKRGIVNILAETDTIPFNRYAKSARYLHAQYTAAILEGCVGAKHWLTRTAAYEPDSGKAYRAILAEHRQFYEALIPLAREIRWVGLGHVFAEQNTYNLAGDIWASYSGSFVTANLERMGIPFYFTEAGGEAVFLEDHVVTKLSDETLENLFRGSVFVTAEAAGDLIARGYAAQLGVSVAPYEGQEIQYESFTGGLDQCCTPQKAAKQINVLDDAVQTLSWNVLQDREQARILSPAVTCLRREAGLSVVFCGTPNAKFNYMEGFSFLNESRKAQLIALLRKAGALPVYCPGDGELCFRAGVVGSDLLACVYPLGIDPQAFLDLYLEKAPTRMQRLQKDGTWQPLSFAPVGENTYRIDVKIEALYPVILKIT